MSKASITQRLYNEAHRQLMVLYHNAQSSCHAFNRGGYTPNTDFNPFIAAGKTYDILINQKDYDLLGKVESFGRTNIGGCCSNPINTNYVSMLCTPASMDQVKQLYPKSINVLNDIDANDYAKLKQLYQREVEKSKTIAQRQNEMNTKLDDAYGRLQLELASLTNLDEVSAFLVRAKEEFTKLVNTYKEK